MAIDLGKREKGSFEAIGGCEERYEFPGNRRKRTCDLTILCAAL